jgi:hypothetical protein
MSERSPRKRWAQLAALSALLFARASLAEGYKPAIGAFLGLAFDQHRPTVEWGFEFTQVFNQTPPGVCGSNNRTTAGFFTHVSVLGLSRPGFASGIFGGSEIGTRDLGIMGEVGVAARFDDTNARWGIHSGLLFEHQHGFAYVRQRWLLNQPGVGIGARSSPIFKDTSSEDCRRILP